MRPRRRVFFAGLAVALLLIPLLALYREFSRPSDIWWTPQGMALPLTESQDRVRLYVQGNPLTVLLEGGQLSVSDKRGTRVLGVDDIRVRLNNWDRVRAAGRPMIVAYAALAGAGATFLLLILSGRLAFRGEKGEVAR